MTDVAPYATAKPYMGGLPAWIADEEERQRIGSYALYEAMYWSVPDTFKVVARGAEDKPIYIPSGRQIVEVMHRYTAPSMTVVPDPMFGTPQEQLLAQQVWTDFARRERVYSKFNANKRYGLIRGDWAFSFYADPLRPTGAKISFFAVDPGSIFPIWNPDNVDEIIGYHIAEQYDPGDGKVYIRRQTYRKATGTGGPSPITYSDIIFEADKWGGPGMDPEDEKVFQQVQGEITLPAPIDQLPIYWIPNFETPGTMFGSSEMRGLERVMAALNQSVSDEELSLALDGLGVYWTDAGQPIDENGQPTSWDLGPARVIEVPNGKKFARLNGVGSVTPYQDHIKLLKDELFASASIPAVAAGRVDVTVAESGVALLLELGPILGRGEEKDLTITDRLTNMFFDLAKWFVAYEGSIMSSLMGVVDPTTGVSAGGSRWVPQYGDKVPPNRTKDLADLLTIAKSTPQIVPMSYVRQRMRKIGFDDLPDDATLEAEILAEQAARAKVQQDAFGAQVDGEVNAELDGDDDGSG